MRNSILSGEQLPGFIQYFHRGVDRYRMWKPSSSVLRPTQLVFVLSALAVLTRLTLFVVNAPFIEGDTDLLVKVHVKAIRACLEQGRLLACPDSGVWPLFQNLPSLLLSYLGFSSSAVLHALAYLSFLSFLGSILVIFWALKKTTSMALAVTGVLVTITSPLLWYSHSTFGEMAAAFLILAFAAACLMRAPTWLMVSLFVLAGSTKEIAFPFLIMIGLLCLMVIVEPKTREKRAVALVIATTITIIATVGFNYFRYGTFFNSSYLSQVCIVPTFKLQLSFFLGIWLSPNGGLAFFWPSFMLLYLFVCGAALLRIAGNKSGGQNTGPARSSLRFHVPLLTISAILFLLTAGFSRWCTPLGGFAWGPRFMLPWIPALTLLLIYFYRDEVSGILYLILRQPIGLGLSALLLIAVSIPQFMILFGDFVLARIFAYSECPRVPIIQEGAAYYYQCLQTQIWPRSILILELYRVALKSPAVWFSILYSVVLVNGLLLIRKYLLIGEISSKKSGSGMSASLTAGIAELQRASETPLPHCLFVIAFYALVFVAFFFPAIYLGNVLAVGGDGLFIYLPNFYSPKVLWDTLLFSGFPMMADPQVATWYPPAFLLSLLPGAWNLFMLLAYISGSSFMYGYVHALTKSRFAGLVSGIVYGLSGFMIAHLGHSVIVHAAAWLPLLIWSIESLRQRWSAKWMIIGSLSVALCFLGGHSQIFCYGLFVTVAYVLVMGDNAPVGRWRFYATALSVLVLGIGLVAVQIIPTAELVQQGNRVGYSFQDFVSHSLPPRQALTMIFPLVFGGVRDSGVLPYFGAVNQTELTGYTGLLPLMLAAIGVAASRRTRVSVFWLAVGAVAFVLAMGEATPLAGLLYHLPILKSFRAPARHFIEFTMAISVLSGLGAAAIVQQKASRALVRKVVLLSSLGMLLCVILLFLNSGYMNGLAVQKGIGPVSLLPWANRAVGVPLLVFLGAVGVLIYWRKRPQSYVRAVLLLLMLVLDLGSFGWFFEWRYASPDKNALNAPERAVRYRDSLDGTNQRLMPYRSSRGSTAEMPPNLTRLWGVPSAGGYDVLILSRISNLLPMIDNIDAPLPWSEPRNSNLDLMAVRYLFLPQDQLTTDERSITWFKQDAQYSLGYDCTQAENKSANLTLPRPIHSTALAIVSRLACSSQIPDGTEVLRLRLIEANGTSETRSIVAGRDTSEWAYDCGVVKPMMHHQRTNIFSSYPASMYGEPCEGHFYLTTLDLGGARDITSIHFDWVNGPGTIIIEKLTLLNEVTHGSYPIDLALMDSAWQLVEETDSSRVYENLRAMPRVWVTPEVVSITAEDALHTIKTGTFEDGRPFDPHQTALVEGPLTLMASEGDRNASAIITGLENTRMDVRTSSKTAGFLVTSDAYYPGWHASIDGQETHLYRADYAIRGVLVPPGEHMVRFEYRPHTLYYGAGISVLSLLILGAIAFTTTSIYRRKKASESD